MKRKYGVCIGAGNLLVVACVMLIRLMTAACGIGGTDSAAKEKMRQKTKLKNKYCLYKCVFVSFADKVKLELNQNVQIFSRLSYFTCFPFYFWHPSFAVARCGFPSMNAISIRTSCPGFINIFIYMYVIDVT